MGCILELWQKYKRFSKDGFGCKKVYKTKNWINNNLFIYLFNWFI